MAQDPEKRRKLIEWLDSKWKSTSGCPICEQKDKWVAGDIFELREFHGGGFKIGGGSTVVPVALITCSNCGYTMCFNAMVAGLISSTGPGTPSTAAIGSQILPVDPAGGANG